MSTPEDMAAEAAGLREIIASLRTTANATAAESIVDLMLAARRAGYREGLAARDDSEAAARARQARASFRVVPETGGAG